VLFPKQSFLKQGAGEMKKNISILTFVGIVLIMAGLVVGAVFDRTKDITNIISVSSTMIGIFAVFYQFVKDKRLNQAAFMVNFNTQFYKSERKNVELLDYFDKLYDDPDSVEALTEKDLDMISPYSAWLSILCALIMRRVFNFKLINDMFRYKFFMFMNNKDVQRLEIEKFPELYAPHFEVYHDWCLYQQKHNMKELNEDTALSKTAVYQNYIQSGLTFLNEKASANSRFIKRRTARKTANRG